MSFSFLGTGSYVPPRVVTNEELSTMVDTTDEWITKRVGVKQRYVCTTETAADLGAEAARRALENSGVRPEELDLILAATVSGEDVCPGVAQMVQHHLGASCPAYDINAACPAFIYLLETAAGYFARGKVKRVLLVGAERMSRIMDWEDRSTCVIFGDGAGAAVLGEGDGYLVSKLYTRGGDDVIKIPQFIGKSPFYEREPIKPYIHMNGQETFKFAVNAMCADVQDVMEEAGVTGEDVAWVVPHQANIRIIHMARKKLDIPDDRFYINIDRYGNMSAACIPLALDELNRAGRLKQGDKVVLCAFGGGLSSAACMIRW